jgi:hypothetical protein
MAFSKKGWRRIVLDDQVYYWQAGEDLATQIGLFDQSSILHARQEREPNRLLIIKCGQCGHQIVGFSGRVTPRIVRGCIECAIISGWIDERPKLQLVLFNTPLRCLTLQPSWLTSTVLALATGIYDDLAFDRMPILADALQDAGCDSDDILNHLRDPNATHVRGCWALDLLLGKE